eukprot:INCI17616.1.p1 GENE.INCI17616.1~~INCI17616.1.p1  ORF type:complete len:430 (-),score=82.64 INCI17616.1:902-2191(-)
MPTDILRGSGSTSLPDMATSTATSQPTPTKTASVVSTAASAKTKPPSLTAAAAAEVEAARVDPLRLYTSLLDRRYLEQLRPMMSDRLGLNEAAEPQAKKSARGGGSSRHSSKQHSEKASPQAELHRASLKEALMCLEQFMRSGGAESSASVPFSFEEYIDGLEQEQAVRRQLAAVLNAGSLKKHSDAEATASSPLSFAQVQHTPSKPPRDASRKGSRQPTGSALRKSTRLQRATPTTSASKRSASARSSAQKKPTTSSVLSRKRKQASTVSTPKAGARTTRSGRSIDPAKPVRSKPCGACSVSVFAQLLCSSRIAPCAVVLGFENADNCEGEDARTDPSDATSSVSLLDIWQTALGLDDDAFGLLRARIAQSCQDYQARAQPKKNNAPGPRQFDVAVERVDCRYDVTIVPRARDEEVLHAASKQRDTLD